jgi:DNA-3-methyladenine glycosylase I
MHEYHDNEWGVPSHDDRYLFEMLILEGAQAGLSWATILNRRDGYRRAFADFDPVKVAALTDRKLEQLLRDPAIIRNRLKVYGARTNARAFRGVQAEFGSFAAYLWGWVEGKRIVNRPHRPGDLTPTTDLSDRISKDLKRRGFTFVGSTIINSFLQASGVVDDHLVGCPQKRSKAGA